jgi:hypothetical protein
MICIMHKYNILPDIHGEECLWTSVFSPDVQHENRSNEQQWHHQDRHWTPEIEILMLYIDQEILGPFHMMAH